MLHLHKMVVRYPMRLMVGEDLLGHRRRLDGAAGAQHQDSTLHIDHELVQVGFYLGVKFDWLFDEAT